MHCLRALPRLAGIDQVRSRLLPARDDTPHRKLHGESQRLGQKQQ